MHMWGYGTVSSTHLQSIELGKPGALSPCHAVARGATPFPLEGRKLKPIDGTPRDTRPHRIDSNSLPVTEARASGRERGETQREGGGGKTRQPAQILSPPPMSTSGRQAHLCS